MELRKVVGWAKGHRNALAVAALICVVAGADLLVNRPKGEGVQWVAVPLLGTGTLLLALVFWPTEKPGPRPPGDTLAQRLLWRLMLGGRLQRYLAILGVVLISGDILFNAYLSRTPALLEHDQSVLLLGGILLAYRFFPEKYRRERDFVLLFALVFVAILVVPLLFLRVLLRDPGATVDLYSAYALAPQTNAIVNLLGVPSTIVYNSEGTPGLAFETAAGASVQVFITSACSGIYSFAIFSSAFSAYVLTGQRKLNRRVVAFFALGILLAYIANVLRMVAIILVGYHFDTPSTGIQNMLFAHSNVGWIIFLLWVTLFWSLLLRILPPEALPRAAEGVEGQEPRRRGTFCGICGIVLTPAIPATRCSCGKFYHLECFVAERACPNCAAAAPLSVPGTGHTSV